MATLNETYTLPRADGEWTISCTPLEILVRTYIDYIEYFSANATNAFEKTLCEKLKMTPIYKIFNTIVSFRSNNLNVSKFHAEILVKFTRKLSPITNTWEASSYLAPIKNVKIGALASAIEGRINFFHQKLFRFSEPSYGKISSEWVAITFFPYVCELHDLISTLVEETRTAISAAKNAGKLEADNKKSNKVQYNQQMKHNQQMQYNQQMHMYQMQHNLQMQYKPQIPGVNYMNGVRTILVLTQNGVVQAELV